MSSGPIRSSAPCMDFSARMIDGLCGHCGWPPNRHDHIDTTELSAKEMDADGVVVGEAATINPKDALGAAKVPLSSVPASAIIHCAEAFRIGAEKYGPFNWREKNVRASIYVDAAMRHILSWFDGEDHARDSGVHHLGHAMACLAILLDAYECGSLADDRPAKGRAADLIDSLHREYEAEREADELADEILF